MIGYAERKILHDINPQIAKSWTEIEKNGDSEIVIGGVNTSSTSKELGTIQEFFSSKEQLLKAIDKYAVRKPERK